MDANEILDESLALQMRNASAETEVLSKESYRYLFADGEAGVVYRPAWEGDRGVLTGDFALDTLEVPINISRIGNYAFYQSAALTSLDIPFNIESIGNYAFYGCNNLTRLIFDDGCKTIGQMAFYNCQKLATLQFPRTLTSIGSNAFRNPYALEILIVGDRCKKIEQFAFGSCSKLSTLIIGTGINEIGVSAFYGIPSDCYVQIKVAADKFTDAQYKAMGFKSGMTIHLEYGSIVLS